VARRLLAMQITAAALIVGVVSFLGIVCFMVYGQQQGVGTSQADAFPMITVIAFGLFAVCAALSFVVPMVQTQSGLEQIASGMWRPPARSDPKAFDGDTTKILAVRETAFTIGVALLEGPAFLGIVCFLIECHPYALTVPTLALVGMLLRFPTEGSLRAWVTEGMDRVKGMRGSGSTK
jgi:hypothetical protein